MGEFSAAEASRLSGFKKQWMLNHLEREGTFVPENPRDRSHGKHRIYTFRDLVILRAINRILELGARPARIKTAIAAFAQVLNFDSSDDYLAEFGKSASNFIVTKDNVIFVRNDNELIELTRGNQLAFAFMINLPMTIEPTARAAQEYVNVKSTGSAEHKRIRLNEIAARYEL